MPEINENERYKERKNDFFEVFGEDVYNKIVEENGYDPVKNVYLSYWNQIKGCITDKEMLIEFSKWWTENFGEEFKTKLPKANLFTSIIKRDFIPFYNGKFGSEVEVKVSENEVDTSNDMLKKSENTESNGASANSSSKMVVDFSSIETKLDESKELIEDSNDILNVLGEAKLENMIYEDVLYIKKVLKTQVDTKTEKKATFAQIEAVENRLHGLDLKMDSILDSLEKIESNMPDQLKEYYSPSDRRNNLLLGLVLGVAIGLVFIILFSVLN